MIANRPKAVFFRRPSKFENGRPKDGWTVGWLRPCVFDSRTEGCEGKMLAYFWSGAREGGGGSYRCVCPKGYIFDSRTKGRGG